MSISYWHWTAYLRLCANNKNCSGIVWTFELKWARIFALREVELWLIFSAILLESSYQWWDFFLGSFGKSSIMELSSCSTNETNLSRDQTFILSFLVILNRKVLCFLFFVFDDILTDFLVTTFLFDNLAIFYSFYFSYQLLFSDRLQFSQHR